VLGSGSGGNSVVVESKGRRILIDAGFSCRQIEKRLAGLGGDAESVEALLLTHEHQDHCRGAAVFLRRHEMPLYATEGTLAAIGSSRAWQRFSPTAEVVTSGEPFEITGTDPLFRVEAFGVPHDAREPVGYVIEDSAGCRLGVVADLGSRTQLAWGRLTDLDCLLLETNHDLSMLRAGPYPWHLKQRIASRHGHLSNGEAAAGLPELVSDRLRTVVLYHLSETNNQPDLASRAIAEKLAAVGCGAEVMVTRQDVATSWIEIPDRPFAVPRPPVGPSQLRLW
ncbi:MAG: MBL fold metallo-hydrolase, partial [Thermoanaerobaculia bacterium]